MDVEKIFNLFDPSRSNSTSPLQENIESTPEFKLGMFIKIITYGPEWKGKVVNLFSNSNSELDLNELDRVGEFILYSRAWMWISEVNLEDDKWVTALNSLEFNNLNTSLNKCLQHFQDEEEYEKCGFIHKIQEFLKKA